MKTGFDRALLVPSDCPALDPAALDWLIEQGANTRSVLIVPDRHGTGTNGLLLTPPGALAPAFGPGSRERHVDNARAAQVAFEVVEVPSLALDVDTADDLTALQETLATTHGGAAHTRGMLSQLLRSRS
jgi:2-phospho-L-lactate guanylyltransferase